MTISATTGATSFDLYRPPTFAPRWRFLHHVNPLAKLVAPIPAIVAALFTHDRLTPIALIALTYAVVLIGAKLTRVYAWALFFILPLALVSVAVGFSLWVDPATLKHAGTAVLSIGDWTLYSGAVDAAITNALRITSLFVLALLSGAATTGPELIRAAVTHLHMPYRIGYTALAAFRFIPRFRHELGVIRAAHRVRGRSAGRGPFAAIARGWGYVLPLMAGAIRHAERVALAMDSRAFGAYDTRTERHVIPWRVTDWLFIAAFLLACAGIFAAFAF